MHHSLQIMLVLPLMTDHLFWKATIFGGLDRRVPLYNISDAKQDSKVLGQTPLCMWQIVILALKIKRIKYAFIFFLSCVQTHEISDTKCALKYHFFMKYFSSENLIVLWAYLVISVPNFICFCELHFRENMNDTPQLACHSEETIVDAHSTQSLHFHQTL